MAYREEEDYLNPEDPMQQLLQARLSDTGGATIDPGSVDAQQQTLASSDPVSTPTGSTTTGTSAPSPASNSISSAIDPYAALQALGSNPPPAATATSASTGFAPSAAQQADMLRQLQATADINKLPAGASIGSSVGGRIFPGGAAPAPAPAAAPAAPAAPAPANAIPATPTPAATPAATGGAPTPGQPGFQWPGMTGPTQVVTGVDGKPYTIPTGPAGREFAGSSQDGSVVFWKMPDGSMRTTQNGKVLGQTPVSSAPAATPAAPTPTANTQQPQTELGAMTQSVLQQMAELQAEVDNPETPTDVQGMYREQLTSILSMIEQEEGKLRAEAQQAGTSLDPATEYTLTKMREELDRQLKQQDMAMNARGLFDSGISVAAGSELRKGNMSDQAMVLSTRLSKIQDDLRKSLSGLSQQKIGLSSEFGKEGLQGQLSENRDIRNVGESRKNALLQARMGLRGQFSDEDRFSKDLDFRTRNAAEELAFKRSEGQANRGHQTSERLGSQGFQAGQQTSQQTHQSGLQTGQQTHQSGMQQQQLAQQAALAKLDREHQTARDTAKTDAERAQADRDHQNRVDLLQREIAAGRFSHAPSGGGAPRDVTRPIGTTTLGGRELALIQQSGNNARDARAALEVRVPQLIRDGLTADDLRRLYEAVDQLPHPTQQPISPRNQELNPDR